VVVGKDPGGDVALLKLEGKGKFPFVKLGDSQAVRPGQRVLALGAPFLTGAENVFVQGAPANFEPAVSMGIVSAVHRYSETYNDAIQVDLAVNRGNSGGPLITLDGKVVGINGKIETRFALGINTGVGYAVTSNQISRFMKHLEMAEGGAVLHGKIEGLEVGERADEKAGLPVVGVRQGSPAAVSGFKAGDLLERLGGLPVRTRSRYMGILGTYPAGDTVAAEVLREGEKLTLKAVLVAGGKAHLGLIPRSIESEVAGVGVGSVVRSSPAQRAGIKAGDIVTMFDGQPISSTTELKRVMNQRRPGDTVVLKLSRAGENLELKVTLGGK
ncbi:MAG: PDZ domain-containing protein, partial [Planctomycetes bacterium]|nr:PDZ domain-containing protein [Planctomycetota bacterium]